MWEPGRSIVKVPPPPPPKHLKQYHKLENYGHENQNFTASDPSSIYDPGEFFFDDFQIISSFDTFPPLALGSSTILIKYT